MFARLTRYEGSSPDAIDQTLETKKRVLPTEYGQTEGMKGTVFLVDRESGAIVVMSLWESADAMNSSEPDAARLREEVYGGRRNGFRRELRGSDLRRRADASDDLGPRTRRPAARDVPVNPWCKAKDPHWRAFAYVTGVGSEPTASVLRVVAYFANTRSATVESPSARTRSAWRDRYR